MATQQIRAVESKQIQTLQAIVRALKIDTETKEDLVRQFSGYRGTSFTCLHYHEAEELINKLQPRKRSMKFGDSSDKMRKSILHMAHQMGWKMPSGKVDIQRIDNWCKEYGYLHKGLNEYKYNELPKLVTQFENVYKSFLKAI